VVKNIASRGGNPRDIYLFGHSSGAMLVALAGSDAKYLKSFELTLADIRGVIPAGSIMWDKAIQEAIASNGRGRVKERFRAHPDYRAFDSLEQYEDMWAFRHVHAGLPRFLFLVAEEEQVNPPVLETNTAFVDAARKLGNGAECRVLAGETHYSLIRGLNEKGSAAFDIIVRFVKDRPSSPS
jgi:acetyl esterase/lipase